MKKILVIDGNSIINRAFYGLRLLKASNGRYTNAVYGMVNIVKRQIDALKPDYAAVAFDLKAPTFRHEMYSEYKAGRKPTPPELLSQFPDAKECLEAMGIHVLSMPGWEADDIQGTVAGMAGTMPDTHAYVLSGDRDLLQLIDDRTTVLLAGNQSTDAYDEAAFFAKYGIYPSQFVDAKALMGDSSDHIPGVPGVGEKTAMKLISLCGSLDGVYRMLDPPEERTPDIGRAMTDGLCRKLTEGRDSAYMSQKLARICCEVPLGLSPDDLRYHGVDNDRLYRIFLALEFGGFITRFHLVPPHTESGDDGWEELSGDAVFQGDAVGDAAPSGNPGNDHDAADPSTDNGHDAATDTNPSAAGKAISDTAFAVKETVTAKFQPDTIPVRQVSSLPDAGLEEGGCVSVTCFDNKWHLYTPGTGEIICDCEDAALAPLFDGSREIVCYDSKALWHRMRTAGVTIICVPRDVMLSGYLFRGGDGQVSVESLSLSLAGCTREEAEERQAALLYALDEALLPRLREMGSYTLAKDVEWPLAPVLGEMEETGFALDTEGMAAFGDELTRECETLTERIYTLAGHPFNLNSPKQLAQVLFEELKLPAQKKTKSGYSTDAETLENLRDAHPIVADLLEYRQVLRPFRLSGYDADARTFTLRSLRRFRAMDDLDLIATLEVNGRRTAQARWDCIGIPPEHQGRVFERFYRVDKSHSKASGGTGLGLSIVKHAVAYHHGTVELQSEVGRGTEITVRLPRNGRPEESKTA